VSGVLLDSVIVIDHLNGVGEATAFLRAQGGAAAVSAITRAEVLAGCAPLEAPRVASLLDRYRFLPMDAPIADEAARVRRDTALKLLDAIQAAFALRHGLRLATRNTKDFAPARFPFVFAPYRLR
jgi:predicted nucleic acid-binding protein